MVKERRKLINYSIKRQMQLRLLGRVMAVVLISLGLAAVIFYLYSDQEVGRSFKEFHVHARNFLDFLLPVVIVTFFLGVFAASGLAVFFPHRIAGPLYRLERDLKEKVGGGDLTVSFSVRKGDELRELADALNIMNPVQPGDLSRKVNRTWKQDGRGNQRIQTVRPIVLNICLSIFIFSLIASCAALPRISSNEQDPVVKKVAVLPFQNISGNKYAGNVVANAYVTELFNTGRFLVEEPGNIRRFMIQERVDTIGEMELDRLKVLGRRLRVDAIVVGTVEEFDGGRGVGVPVVSVTARMVEASSGRIIWSGQNRRKGDDYIIVFDLGEVRTVTTLTQKVVKEMVDTIKW
jgi:TolB-like protein